jgi:hypothetical protein
MTIYLALTQQFNAGRQRAVICSGQAVVLHRLAIMSKDGDWILREDAEALGHVLKVLSEHEATYRFGAPLDVRWMSGGWSSHFQFRDGPVRVRTDFFTRPPRISAARLAELWREQEGREVPFVGLTDLAELKKTNRERDYAVIGELARRMTSASDQLLHSRSARDLIKLARQHPDLVSELSLRRPLLQWAGSGRGRLEQALDAERRDLIRANEARLQAYMTAAEEWAAAWPDVEKRIAGLPLLEAHELIVERAEGALPFGIPGDHNG